MEQGEGLSDRLRELLETADDAALRAYLADLHAADVADFLEQVAPEERSRILFLLPPRVAAEAIVLLEEAVRSDVLDVLTDREVSNVLKELPADDAVDVLDELDAEIAEKVVEHLTPEQKAAVEPLRQFDPDSAGGIMNTEFVSVPATAAVGDAIDRIRQVAEKKKLDLYYVYCVDDRGKLVGVVPPVALITASPSLPLERLLLSDLFTAHVDEDQERIKNKFDKYDIAALPVVDDRGHMVGVITHDDVLEVAEEEAEEDILRMAGTAAEEFASTSILRAAGIRARWLLPCLIGTFVGSMIAIYFGPSFSPAAYEIVFPFIIPIAAMGGNAGVQISTVIVRALATGDPLGSRFRSAALREMRIAVTIGAGAGLFAGLGAYALVSSGWMPNDLGGDSAAVPLGRVAVSVGLAMTFAILISGTLGLTMPFVFRRAGIDPAIATGPLITTCNDALSACVYLLIALSLLH